MVEAAFCFLWVRGKLVLDFFLATACFHFVYNGHFALHALFERNERVGRDYAGDVLDAVVEQFHEVLVVIGIQLAQYGERACGKVTLNNFLDFFQFGKNLTIHICSFESHTNVGASVVAKHFGIYQVPAFNHLISLTKEIN